MLIVVSTDQNLVTIQSLQDREAFPGDDHIAEMINFIVFTYDTIPILNHRFIHFFTWRKWTKQFSVWPYKRKAFCMPKVSICCEEDIGHLKVFANYSSLYFIFRYLFEISNSLFCFFNCIKCTLIYPPPKTELFYIVPSYWWVHTRWPLEDTVFSHGVKEKERFQESNPVFSFQELTCTNT